MPDIEPFLAPIPGDSPCGENLKYSPEYDKIREARRQEDSGPMGAWEREVKTADFKLVIKVGEEALIKKTKDLQIAAWLVESWASRDRFPGLISGLQLLKGLLERFWDGIYPEIDEGDAEPRATPIEWVGSYFDPSKGSSPIFQLRSIPLTLSGFDYFVYQESRRMGFESEIRGNDARTKARAAAIKDKKTTPEDFDKDFEATPKAFYKKLASDAVKTSEAVEELDTLCRDLFADVAPTFTPLKKALEEYANVVHILLLKKLEKEPDPVEVAPPTEEEVAAEAAAEAAADEESAAGGAGTSAGAKLDFSALAGGEIKNSDQATLHVLAAAQYLRRQYPASPVSYLLLRALRWGELRAATDLANLPAPGQDVRIQLKQSAERNDWKKVLETAESAMSTPCGRGWLDLQRYTIRACDELGHTMAATAMRSELKALLIAYPKLPLATLSDDTGAANPDTFAWLQKEALQS